MATALYRNIAKVYDHIMEDGVDGPYYDYDPIAAQIAAAGGESLLEAGCGTGKILQRTLRLRPYERVTGFDVTGDMLAIARDRVGGQAELIEADAVELDLDDVFDVVATYGGVCYAIPDGAGAFNLVSHIRDDALNARALTRLAAHLAPGGRFLLGVQDPHTQYDAELTNGDVYSQRLFPLPGGLRKLYLLTSKNGDLLMDPMLLEYRVYPAAEALGLLAAAGLRPVAWQRRDPAAKFLVFTAA
jgi:SAM-dependent methyltransferase